MHLDKGTGAVGAEDRTPQSSALETGLQLVLGGGVSLVHLLLWIDGNTHPLGNAGLIKRVLIGCVSVWCCEHVWETMLTQWVCACVYVADTISLSVLHN